jgi:hypothetical protein
VAFPATAVRLPGAAQRVTLATVQWGPQPPITGVIASVISQPDVALIYGGAGRQTATASLAEVHGL